MMGIESASGQSFANADGSLAGVGMEFLEIVRALVKGHMRVPRFQQGAAVVDDRPHD